MKWDIIYGTKVPAPFSFPGIHTETDVAKSMHPKGTFSVRSGYVPKLELGSEVRLFSRSQAPALERGGVFGSAKPIKDDNEENYTNIDTIARMADE